MHAELSSYYLHFIAKKSVRETHPSEFSNIDGRDLTPDIIILPYLCLRLISLHDSVSPRKAGMLVFTWWHYFMDKFTNVSRNSETMGALTYLHREKLIFSKTNKQTKKSQWGSRKGRTKTWIAGFQLHTETKQQQQTKGAGLASALNQGQMSCRGDGQLRGEAGNGALAASQEKCSPAQLYAEKGTEESLPSLLFLLPPP